MELTPLVHRLTSHAKANRTAEREGLAPQPDSDSQATESKASLASTDAPPLLAVLRELAGTTDASDAALQQARQAINRELELRARRTLKLAADQYINALGADEGMKSLAEDLCRHVAPKAYSGGWSGLVQHIVKISG
ncbi:hypothetical protein MW290_32210 (plasmid) [Aquincola tertiaricarbonis]|uniref:Uncharacterized protein n=1 Tax=Aquincola tertiaricarbonis TaxID=391953 RepID=A0ABY4SLW0_AQUTE|nr:hypothetical protein [Aquincola tertiaricarbonis]URI11991.1 hypothetical protein MW290_32210 [Aquincola tertiaricarbonis]